MQTNKRVAKDGFAQMAHKMRKYDSDGNFQLDTKELKNFFFHEIPRAVSTGVLDQAMREGQHDTNDSGGTTFTEFMMLLYVVLVRLPGSTIRGMYANSFNKVQQAQRFAHGKGPACSFWQQLAQGFAACETDFRALDTGNSGTIDREEITSAIPRTVHNNMRLDMIGRLQHAFMIVDVDRSGSLDFFEYLHLAFMMTQNGPYKDLIQNATNPALVKKCMMHIQVGIRRPLRAPPLSRRRHGYH